MNAAVPASTYRISEIVDITSRSRVRIVKYVHSAVDTQRSRSSHAVRTSSRQFFGPLRGHHLSVPVEEACRATFDDYRRHCADVTLHGKRRVGGLIEPGEHHGEIRNRGRRP